VRVWEYGGRFMNRGFVSNLRIVGAFAIGSFLCVTTLRAWADSDSPPAASDELDTVVVTAERHTERAVDTPIAVTSLSAARLQEVNVTNTLDLGQLVPGVIMNEGSGVYVEPSIRGVSSNTSGPGTASNVATYVDGFYIPSELGNDFGLSDVKDVEVLKGPQGTLFGRNATGGAIVVTTLDPSHETAANIQVGYGRFNTEEFEGYVTSGLTDTIAYNADLYLTHSNGYILNTTHDDYEDRNYEIRFRGKLSFDPTDDLKIIVTYEYGKVSDPTAAIYLAYHGNSAGNLIPGAVVATDFYRSTVPNEAKNIVTDNAEYLRVNWDLHWATFKSWTGYRYETADEFAELDASSINVFSVGNAGPTERTFTQEFNLSSPDSSRLVWVAGAFFMNDYGKINAQTTVLGDAASPFITSQVLTTSWAIYGDATYPLLDNLYLTAGLRYSGDHADYDVLPGAVPPASSAQAAWYATTPRGVLRYKLTPDSNVYFSYSKGYKSGAFNPESYSTTPVDPEHITAYEVGYKINQHWWEIEASAYHYAYTNQQVASYVFTSSQPVQQLLNAASSTIKGGDVQFSAKATDRLRFDVAAAYTHARYDSFPSTPGAVPIVSDTGLLVGNTITVDNASGTPMIRSPDFSGNVGAQYDQPIQRGTLEFNAAYAYQTKVYFQPGILTLNQPGYGLLNLQTSWVSPEGVYRISAYGRNVTDKQYFTYITPSSFGTLARYGSPSEWGLKLSVKF
jgi:iron complex outermembrane recepter protein